MFLRRFISVCVSPSDADHRTNELRPDTAKDRGDRWDRSTPPHAIVYLDAERRPPRLRAADFAAIDHVRVCRGGDVNSCWYVFMRCPVLRSFLKISCRPLNLNLKVHVSTVI